MSRRLAEATAILGIVVACWVGMPGIAQEDAEAEPVPSPVDEPVIVDLSSPPDTLMVFLDWVNGRRQAAGRAPLEPNHEVFDLVQRVADEITVRARIDADAIEPERFLETLRQTGYPAVRVVVAQAVAPGPWASVIEQWAGADPTTFDGLLHPELSHLAIGVGDVRGTPLYIVLAAAPADLALERRTVALREQLDQIRGQVLERVNAERQRAGQPPLRARRLLDRVAQGYAEAMVQRGFYGHTSPEGQTVLDRVRATGYRPLRVGENLASGQTSVDQVMAGWLASPDHRANIAHPAFRELGVGVVAEAGADGRFRVYWVQVFADPR